MNRRDWLASGVCALVLLSSMGHVSGKTGGGAFVLHSARGAESDLEIGGDLPGTAGGGVRYASYEQLLRLPQATYSIADDSNFVGRATISGVPLIELAKAAGANAEADLAVAICYDGYRTNYSQEYMAAHRPLLVLKINGKTQADWPRYHDGRSFGPYMISHPAFTPSFRILSHEDEAQIPFGVTRIEFRDQKRVLGSIAPLARYTGDARVMNGYRIAQQDCFRCHNMGAEGGQLAGISWRTIGMWAATEPKYFEAYVKSPQSFDKKNRMAPHLNYDAATLDALRAYFATFDEGTHY